MCVFACLREYNVTDTWNGWLTEYHASLVLSQQFAAMQLVLIFSKFGYCHCLCHGGYILSCICLFYCCLSFCSSPRVGPGHPSPSLSFYFLIFSPFHFFLSFIGFTYFLLLPIPSLSTRIVPLRFQAGGRRRRSNLGLVFLCNLCYLYSLVKMYCGALFYLV